MKKKNKQEKQYHFKYIFPILLMVGLLLAACQPAPTEEIQQLVSTSTAIPAQPETLLTATLIPPSPTPQPPTPEPVQTLPFEPRIALEAIASGFTAPVALATPDDGSSRLFIVDQVGLIYVLQEEGNLLETPFLDLRSKLVALNTSYDERGLLGMAFHPEYASNGRFFVYYSAPLQAGGEQGYNHTSILSEFSVSNEDPHQADPDSEKIILKIDQPQSNHNAGAITFGPDGYLYVPLGDGGAGSDVGFGHAEDWYDVNAGGNGQNVEENMLGSVLRIDIDNGDPYGIPDDNPRISVNHPEIWAFGFRNPYRMAFDMGGEHELFLGDAGQELWEEVSIVVAGGNYGWNVREGTHCFSTAYPGIPDAILDCPTQDPQGNPLIDPIIEFPNLKHPDGGLGSTIVGGVVYRGSILPAWDGRYIFGQWSISSPVRQGGLSVAERSDQGLWNFEKIQIVNHENEDLGAFLLALGQDLEGEVYVLTSQNVGPSGHTGVVYRIREP